MVEQTADEKKQEAQNEKEQNLHENKTVLSQESTDTSFVGRENITQQEEVIGRGIKKLKINHLGTKLGMLGKCYSYRSKLINATYFSRRFSFQKTC